MIGNKTEELAKLWKIIVQFRSRSENLQNQFQNKKNENTRLEKLLKDVQQQNSVLEKKLEEVQKEIIENQLYTRFAKNYFLTRRNELEQLTGSLKTKIEENSCEWPETLLEAQAEITQGNKSFQKALERSKKILSKELTKEELQILLDKQLEVTQLEKQLTDLQIQEQKETVSQIQIPPK